MASADAAAFLVVVGILTWFSPMFSLYLFVLVSPLGVVNDLLGWDPRVRWALLLCVRAAWESWKTGTSYMPSVAAKLWIAYAAFAAAGLWIGTSDLLPEAVTSAQSLLLYLIAGGAGLYAVWQLVRTKRQLRILYSMFASSVLLASLIGIVQAAVDYRSVDPSGRIAGPLQNPNYYATYLALAATTMVLLIRSGAINRSYGYTVCSLAAITCAMTLSRIGILAMLVGVCMAAFVQWDKNILSLRILGIVGAVMLVGVGLLTTYVLQFRRGITYSADSESQTFEAMQVVEDLSRLEAFRYSVQLTAEHPLAGVGFGTFQDRNYSKNGLYVTTHNTVMEVLVGTGILGAILIVSFVVSLVLALPPQARRYMCPAVAAFGMCALFGDYLQSLEIFVVLAVLYSSARYLRQDNELRISDRQI